jgi:hypothetical protein
MIEKMEAVLGELRGMANPENVAGMAKFGINPEGTLGISIYDLRKLAKRLGKDHDLATALYKSSIHEAKILACFVADPQKVTPELMDEWALGFDSWDVTDQVCTSLFDQSEYAWGKADEWSRRPEEFVKRGAFALMAGLAWHHKTATDERFDPFLNGQQSGPLDRYEAIIGLETHVQLNTTTKVFCPCKADSWQEAPNSNICPICTGMPGVLPALNRSVVEKAVKLATAMNANINDVSYFDRKNYFYPDLPKGYQISQYDTPLAEGGYLAFPMPDGEMRRVRLIKDAY